MTTAAQKLAEYGVTLAQAHEWVLQNMGNPQAVLDVALSFGVTNAMLGEIAAYPNAPYSADLVKAFFLSHGIVSTGLDPAISTATVTSVSGGSAVEGNGVSHAIFLESATTSQTSIPYSLDLGTTSESDFAYTSWGNGVVAQGGNLIVPAGVSVINFQVSFADDSADEPNESYSLTVGGKTGTGTIQDNDEPPPPASGSVLLPAYMDNLAPALNLNTRTGALSNESLRAQVLANPALTDKYWAIFNPARFEGSGDGVFTPEELGVSHLGTIAATKENIESLFFGTYLDVGLSFDMAESTPKALFFVNNLLAITQKDPVIVNQYMDLFVQAEATPTDAPIYAPSYLQTMVVIGLQGIASAQNPINPFESLISL